MNNKVKIYKDYDKALESLKEQKNEILELVSEVTKAGKGNLYSLDQLIISGLHRSLYLTSGFIDLIESKNYMCAIHLVRLNLDTTMRISAAWRVNDPEEFSLKILQGKRMNKIVDRNHKQMTDNYLMKKLSEKYIWVEKLYKETSGLIHFSNKHVFSTFKVENEKEHTVKIVVSESDSEIPEENKVEAVNGMIHLNGLLFMFAEGWAKTKDIKNKK